MAWLKIREELEGHPKLIDLMNLMGWDKDKALGKLVSFWIWCSRYADDGDLRKHNDDRLGAAVGCCPGEDSKRFVGAMKQACWLDSKPYFRVHDWWDHFGDFLKSKYTHSSEKWEYVKQLYSKGLARAKPAKIEKIDREERKKDIPPPPEWFVQVWSKYPKKVGKEKAELAFDKSIKSEEDLRAIYTALENYLASERVKSGYIQDGSRWFKGWKEWVNFKDNSPKSMAQPPGLSPIAKADMKAAVEAEQLHKAQEAAFDRDLAAARALPGFPEIEAEAKKRLPQGRFTPKSLLSVSVHIVEIYRESLVSK